MILKPYNELPSQFQNDEVKRYYDILNSKKPALVFKRVMDIFFSFLLSLILLLPMLIIAACIKLDSNGPVLYKQERVTTYGKKFMIYKFRSMTVGADKAGALVTSQNDARITKTGKFLRKFRLDELPQVFNVLFGDMSIVGTRPEVQKYVDRYTPSMYATLLMPAGITSLASIKYKDEDAIIGEVSDPSKVDDVYCNDILPDKMKFNLEYIEKFGFFSDIKLMFETVKNVFL